MEKSICKFLDNYLGDEVVCIKDQPTRNYHYYKLYSKNNKTLILLFQVRRNDGAIVIFRSSYLVEIVSDFFSMDPNETSSIIRNWFGGKHNIKKVGDLMKFVN